MVISFSNGFGVSRVEWSCVCASLCLACLVRVRLWLGVEFQGGGVRCNNVC